MTNETIKANNLYFNFIGWKSYNKIKKKAMEQKFSWSGLIISLSIAFFIVFSAAQILSLLYQSMEAAQKHEYFIKQKVYFLEESEHINPLTQQNYKQYLIINIKYI